MVDNPCNDEKRAELVFLNAAITHLCGMNPRRVAMIRRLSRRYDELYHNCASQENAINYPPVNDEVAPLIGEVSVGRMTIEDAKEEFLRSFDQSF
jgi:hypothetical protein